MYTEDEVEGLKDRLDTVQRECDELREWKEAILGEHEEQIRKLARDLEREWKERLEYVEHKAEEKNAAILNELELVRAGFNGDSCGWESRPGGKYTNTLTGEERDTEPEVLYIASIVRRSEEADKLANDMKSLKIKADESILAKNEADIAVLKLKTELNSYKALQRQWVETSQQLSAQLLTHRETFDTNLQRLETSLEYMAEKDAVARRQRREIDKVAVKVKAMNVLIQEQQLTIRNLNMKVQSLEDDIAIKQRLIDRYTKAFNEEVERKLQPIQEKLAEATALVLRQNALRIRELRDIASLWPAGFLMPTLLVMHRVRTKEDRLRQEQRAREHQASLALALEIRNKVKERKQWSTDYDDYGRMFYKNNITGEVLWEEPEIMTYKPPAGRDEAGALLYREERDWSKQFRIVQVENGRVLYQDLDTNEVVGEIPHDYLRVPQSRTLEAAVKEAAQLVMSYIKKKILRKMAISEAHTKSDEDQQALPTLEKFIYDIETVEMLAEFPEESDGVDKSVTKWRPVSAFMSRDTSIGKAAAAGFTRSYSRPFELDVEMLSIAELRKILATVAVEEERVEAYLALVRTDLKDYSFLLVQRVKEAHEVAQITSTPVLTDADAVILPTEEGSSSVPRLNEGLIEGIYDMELHVANTGSYIFGDLSIDYHGNDDSIADSIISICEKLTNFALFCGYCGVGARDAYSPSFKSLFTSESDPNLTPDDEWLSTHFFLTVSRERLDAVYESMSATAAAHFEENGDDWQVRGFHSKQDPQVGYHKIWRERQLVSEVLRFHIQEEVVSDVAGGAHLPSQLSINFRPTPANPGYQHCLLRIHSIRVSKLTLQPWDQYVYVRIQVGPWESRTASIQASTMATGWLHLDIYTLIDEARITFSEVVLELCVERTLSPPVVLGRCTIKLGSTLQTFGKESAYWTDLDCGLLGKGEVALKLSVDEEKHVIDSASEFSRQIELQKRGEILRSAAVKEKRQKPRLLEEQETFNRLIESLKGDPSFYIRALNGETTREDIESAGFQFKPSLCKPSPNFEVIKHYLVLQDRHHVSETNKRAREIDSLTSQVKDLIRSINDAFDESIASFTTKIAEFETEIASKKTELRGNEAMIAKLRRPIPPPNPPVFPELREISFVPQLPVEGRLNAKGKPKKKLRSFMVEDALKRLAAGGQDGMAWDFGDLWPDAQQEETIRAAIEARNANLLESRVKEEKFRKETQDMYERDVRAWEEEEARRIASLNECKKKSRLINIVLEANTKRIEASREEISVLREQQQALSVMMAAQSEAAMRYYTARGKQKIERIRLVQSIHNLKRRLAQLMNARKNALELPNASLNEVNFEYLTRKSESLLKSIRIEIMNCKYDMILEGSRLRSLLQKESSSCTCEFSRLKFFLNTVRQCKDINDLVLVNRRDILGIMSKLEGATLAAAANDTDPFERTVNKQGEKYLDTIEWDDEAVKASAAELADALARLESTKGIRSRYLDSQANSMQAMSAKWVPELAVAKSAGTANLEFERAEQLKTYTLKWLQVKVMQLQAFEKQVLRSNAELMLELECLRKQNVINLDGHYSESLHVKSCALNVIDTLQKRLVEKETAFNEDKLRLDAVVLQISKECQDIREKATMDAEQYEEKIKLLRIMLRTFEYSMVQIASRLQVVLEEKRLMGMSFRVEVDELRFELRRERKHCANLFFIMHSLRSTITDLRNEVDRLHAMHVVALDVYKTQNRKLRRDVYKQIYCLAYLSTDVKSLFEFFTSRIANIAGSRKHVNDELARYKAADVLAALCKNPNIVIRKYATKALSGLGWNSYAEVRLLMWDCVSYWDKYVSSLSTDDNVPFEEGFKKYLEVGKLDILVPVDTTTISDSEVGKDDSMRAMLTKRRQWALRSARRKEGPHVEAQGQITINNGVIATMFDCLVNDRFMDWEVIRNISLAFSISSYDDHNRLNMMKIPYCAETLTSLCTTAYDVEVNCNAAVTIANVVFNEEPYQDAFGTAGIIPVLLQLCRSNVTDVLETCTAALANLTSISDNNCQRILSNEGVAIIFSVILKDRAENILDLDQFDEVQVNAVEVLTNISRYDCELLATSFNGAVITNLVLLCASPNMLIKRQVALIFGNIAQNDNCRVEICSKSGIEALVLLLEETDTSLQANVLWALSNLMWYAPNQERAGRFLKTIVEFLISPIAHIRANAFLLLANLLYYSDTNCDRYLSIFGSLEMLVGVLVDGAEEIIIDCCLRALLSLSCIDAASLWLGSTPANILVLLRYSLPATVSVAVSRVTLEILANLCIHDANRRCMIDNHGVEVLVDLFTHDPEDVVRLANQIVDRLKDLAPPESAARIKAQIGLDNMIQLTNSADPLVRLAAVEYIGESILSGSEKHRHVASKGGIEALLRLCEEHVSDIKTLIPSVWSLKNLINSGEAMQTLFGECDGIHIMVNIIDRCVNKSYGVYTMQILEAALSCLQAAVLEAKSNARFLVQHSKGLDLLIKISTNLTKSKSRGLPSEGFESNETGAALCSSMLHMLGKYNYIICKHCSKKQDVNGTNCLNCGYKLSFDVVDTSKIKRKQKLIVQDTEQQASTGGVHNVAS